MLKFYGLQSTDRFVDVGCGAGRLAAALEGWFIGEYTGTDVVPSLLRAAKKFESPQRWKFTTVAGIETPPRLAALMTFACFPC